MLLLSAAITAGFIQGQLPHDYEMVLSVRNRSREPDMPASPQPQCLPVTGRVMWPLDQEPEAVRVVCASGLRSVLPSVVPRPAACISSPALQAGILGWGPDSIIISQAFQVILMQGQV